MVSAGFNIKRQEAVLTQRSLALSTRRELDLILWSESCRCESCLLIFTLFTYCYADWAVKSTQDDYDVTKQSGGLQKVGGEKVVAE